MVFNDLADILTRQTWQIAIVFGVVWACSKVLHRAHADWRYMLWFLVIAKCVTPPFVTIPIALLPTKTQVKSEAFTHQSGPGKRVDVDAQMSQLPGSTSSEFPPSPSDPTLTNVSQTTPATPQQIAPGRWLIRAWMLIVVSILASVVARIWKISGQLTRQRVLAGDEIQNVVDTRARILGIKQVPKVYSSSISVQPFVWGLIRGDIYVPLDFRDRGTLEQRQAVLAHELAHVARCDAAINIFQIVVQSLFFFHPLVRLANRRIRLEREKCCDELVLSDAHIEPELYCNSIVEFLAKRSRQTDGILALAITGSITNIEDRIVTILSPHRKFRRRPSFTAFATIVLAAACLLPTTVVLTSRSLTLAQDDSRARENAKEAERKVEPQVNVRPAELGQEQSIKQAIAATWQPGQIMEFRAIDARTKQPLSDVSLELQNWGPGIDFQDVKTQKTDADGLSLVKFPDLPTSQVRIYSSKPGYVPLRVYWEGEPHAILPKSITIPMEPGKEFGGIIRNKAGKPISNVTVTIAYYARGAGKNPHIRANFENEKTTSDANGRWRLNIMPADISAKDLRIYVTHPDYLSDYLPRGHWPFPVIEQPPLKELFDQSAVMVMSAGEIVEGQVSVAQSGQPISNARIYLTDLSVFDTPRSTSDKDGHFKITGIDRTTENGMTRNSNYPLALIVQAKDYAPELIEVKSTSGPLTIQMNPAAFVHGKIVDEAGTPVAGVTVSANRWRGRQNQLQLRAVSAADGSFTIKDAPTEEVEYSAFKEGYLAEESFNILPSPEEYLVTLRPLIQIVGTVVDAESGRPLKDFSVMQGIDFDDGRAPFWLYHDKKTHSTANYVSIIQQKNFNYRVRVEADGYMPGESRLIKPYAPDKGQITVDFELQKASKLTGSVETHDGKPLANAEVFLVRERMNIKDRKVTYVGAADQQSVRTDSTGHFEFPPEVETFCLIVIHEQGLGMVAAKQFAVSQKIMIQPWETQKEQLQIIPRPAAGQSVDFPIQYP